LVGVLNAAVRAGCRVRSAGCSAGSVELAVHPALRGSQSTGYKVGRAELALATESRQAPPSLKKG